MKYYYHRTLPNLKLEEHSPCSGGWSTSAFLLMSILFFPIGLNAQAESFFNQSAPPAKKVLKEADKAFEVKDYYTAMKYYEYVLDIEEEPLIVLYKYAEAARFFTAYTFADTAYTKVLERDTTDNYPILKFHLGTVKKTLGQFEEAAILFEEFVAEKEDTGSELVTKAKEEAIACNWAAQRSKEPDPDIEIHKMSEAYNTPDAEFGAVEVGNTTYYSSLGYERIEKKVYPPRKFSKIYKSEDGGTPTLASFNDEELQTAYVSFNKDQSRVYYTLCAYTGQVESKCKIYFRNVFDGNFGEPVALPNYINLEGSTNTQPSIGYDQKTEREILFFVSDREEGGIGGLDIWASLIDEEGGVTPPSNLKEVNTRGDDITPYFHNESQTLYFSSNGRQSLGAFDVYQSPKNVNDWGMIEHLPAPINTSYNDSHYYLNPQETGGYLSSNRLGSTILAPEFEACCNDLYAFSINAIDLNAFTFNIKDKAELEGVTVDLFVINENGDMEKLETFTNYDGNDFSFPRLKKDKKYVLVANKKDFLPLRDTIDLTDPELKNKRKIDRNLYLVPIYVDLNVFTFNKKSKRPLPGVEVRLALNGDEIDYQKNEDGNDTHFTLKRGNVYQVIGTRVGFVSDTAIIDLKLDSDVLVIDEDLFLRQKEVEDFPPLMIFFDNDHPNPRTRTRTTDLTYTDTYNSYVDKKDLFISEYTKVLEGRDSFLASKRIEAFFEREVKNNYQNLHIFMTSVFDILESNYKVVLEIKGFTSPRAAADYNELLSSRRANCLYNELMTFESGILKRYLDSGQLSIKEISFGESTAPQFISDKLEDARESIYSLGASFERKVEIVGVRIEQTN